MDGSFSMPFLFKVSFLGPLVLHLYSLQLNAFFACSLVKLECFCLFVRHPCTLLFFFYDLSRSLKNTSDSRSIQFSAPGFAPSFPRILPFFSSLNLHEMSTPPRLCLGRRTLCLVYFILNPYPFPCIRFPLLSSPREQNFTSSFAPPTELWLFFRIFSFRDTPLCR